MSIVTFSRGNDVQLSEHFFLWEYECKCGKCPSTFVSERHVERLEALRKSLAEPITINSAFRCHKYNKKIGGRPNSFHLTGGATDIVVKNYTPDEVADLCEHFTGLGRYNTFTHIDSRIANHARWDERT